MLLVFLFVIFDVTAGQYFGEIGCNIDSNITGCEPRKPCTVTCTSPCSSEGVTPYIYGTGSYWHGSPICRSAVHDYRIAAFSSNYNVTFIKSAYNAGTYLPSIQQGISSTLAQNTDNGYFYFSSPYITEDVLDVATLNYMYLYQTNGSFIQSCQSNDKTADFQYYIPLTAVEKGSLSSTGWQEVKWSEPTLQPGGYWCKIDNNTYSNVMSLAMASDAHIIPDQWTLTTSVGEAITIKFWKNRTLPGIQRTTGMKDEQTVIFQYDYYPNGSNGFYLQKTVDVGDAGIYSLEFVLKRETPDGDPHDKRGVMRLIVRRCKTNIFGPNCDQQCPECQNGGVCHDVMGVCICRPGFNGTNCENRCPTGYFGQRCSLNCASSQHAIENSCKGALICLPDPYGCSCAVGYKGLACDQLDETTTTTTPEMPTTTCTTTCTTTTSPYTTETTTTTITTSTSNAITVVPTEDTKHTTNTISTTSPMNTTPTFPISPQESMCQAVTNVRRAEVVQVPGNSCQYRCLDSSKKVIPILKTDGVVCSNGVCVKGVCQETTENTGCPSGFNGVISKCKVYCYSDQFPGMSILLNVKNGGICIDKDSQGACTNGKCLLFPGTAK